MANDGVFYGCSGIDEPLKPTRVRIHHEWLSIRFLETEAEVFVRFHFWNPDDTSVSLPVGFVVSRGMGDYNIRDYNIPSVSQFVTQVNDNILVHRLFERTCDTCSLRKPIIIREDNKDFDANYGDHPEHVYLSTIQFKPGLNVVNHSYRQRLSTGIATLSSFTYVLTTAGYWAGQVIDTFECSIAPTPNVVCFIEGFNDLPAPSIVGIGKVEPRLKVDHDSSEFSVYDDAGDLALRLINAEVRFSRTLFRPTSNLSISLFDPWRFLDPMNVGNGVELPPQRRLNDIYACHGLVFKDTRVQRFYETQPWYIADPNCTRENMTLSTNERNDVRDLVKELGNKPVVPVLPPIKK